MTIDDATAPEGKDWTVETADLIETVVTTVRDKTTVPLRTAARAVVYGVALSVVGVVTLTLSIVAFIRVLTVYLPVGRSADHHHRVWVAYLIVGGIFTLAGLFLLRKAEVTPEEGK
jgi:hypothetical protein